MNTPAQPVVAEEATTKSKKTPIIHKDKLGREIKLGNYVAYPDKNTLAFGRVEKINPKMIGITKVSKGGTWRTHTNKYPVDSVILDDSAMTWWLLKQ